MKTKRVGFVLAVLLVVMGAGAAFAGVADIGGTNWRVVAYNVSNYNTLRRVQGDQMRVSFGKNGRIAGKGVNSFTAGYTASRSRGSQNHIDISGIRLSNRAPYSGSGLYRQERDILQAMDGAVSYRMAGGQLDLLYRNGRIAATLLTVNEEDVMVRREDILEHADLAVPYDRPHYYVEHHSVPKHRDIFRTDAEYRESYKEEYEKTEYREYRSGNRRASVRQDGPDAIILTTGGETFRLHRVQDETGIRYVELADGNAELWESDDELTIIVRGNIYPGFVQVH